MKRAAPLALALGFTSTAHAEDVTPPPEPPKWTVSVGATSASVDGQSSQPSLNVAISRSLGKGYVSLSGTLTDSSDDNQPAGSAPEHIELVSISAGRNFGKIMLEAHTMAGRGFFEQGSMTLASGQTIAISSTATGKGLGASASLNLMLAPNLVLTPRIGLDYSWIKIVKTFTDTAVQDDLELKSNGLTTSFSGTLQTRLGKNRQHGLALTASLLHIENTADFVHRVGRVDVSDIGSSSADTLLDYGTTFSIGISHKTGVDFSITRSAGANGPESTVVGANLHTVF